MKTGIWSAAVLAAQLALAIVLITPLAQMARLLATVPTSDCKLSSAPVGRTRWCALPVLSQKSERDQHGKR